MKLKDIYEHSIKIAMANDWRGPERLDAILAKARQAQHEPKFDKDRLFNPYGDTRIACGDPQTEIKNILVGIEIRPEEVLLAGQMRQIGKPVDLCLSHHISCINRGLYYLDDILVTHGYALAEVGANESEYAPVIDRWLSERKGQWRMDTINIAKQLNMPLMNIHTPCDLMHIRQTRNTFARLKDATLGDIARQLNKTEEIRRHPLDQVIIHGDAAARPGKVYNPTGAGWRPLVELFELACKADINTAVLVFPTEEYFTMAREYGVNVVELPHDSNDNFGINLMLDELEKIGGPLTIYEAHNFARVTQDQRKA